MEVEFTLVLPQKFMKNFKLTKKLEEQITVYATPTFNSF